MIMKTLTAALPLLVILIFCISCTQKPTGVSVYEQKGQPYGDPYASAEEYNNVYPASGGRNGASYGSDDFYSKPIGDPYTPPSGGDFAIKPPPPQRSNGFAAAGSIHTVSKGDTLYSISRNYGTTVSALRQANGISGSLIRIGERISIP